MERLLESLNDAQRRAAAHVEGPLLVLAGPGSGKTRVVTHRIAHLVHVGVPPQAIVALSFTNKAADEMRRRLTALIGPQPVELGTFHRFAARLLRRHGRMVGLTSDFSILDPDDAAAVLKRAARRLGLSLTHTPIDRLAGVISRAKNDLLTPETFSPRWGRPAEETARRLWPVYQQLLLEADAVDFDDLLVHVATLLADNPDLRAQLDRRHRWILVDEYQDTNAVQYAIVRALSIDHPNLAVTGDPDQAIYGWRGASIRNILEFERDYPATAVVALEENYRSTGNILGTADRLISHNVHRKPKRLFTQAGPGAPVRIVIDDDGQAEAERITQEITSALIKGQRSPRDFVILFRTNALSRTFEIALRRAGIPHQLVRGVEFFKRREIRDVLAWLRMLRNPRDEEAVLRALQAPPRGLGKQSVERLQAWAGDHQVPLIEALRRADQVGLASRKAANAAAGFIRLHDELSAPCEGVAALLELLLERSGLRDWIDDGDDGDDEDRLANVEELVTAARQFDADTTATGRDDEDPLSAFLDSTALVSDTDAWDPASERVSLMTFHAAKGLEFPIVYMVALEDGILPHERSMDDRDRLEEERRLVFVGITRGIAEVHASCVRVRDYRGGRRLGVPSVFLTEMHGSETSVEGATVGLFTGPRPSADPDADQSVPDIDDPPIPRPFASGRRRADGLTFETEDSPAVEHPPRRRQPAVRVETAAALAARLGNSPAAAAALVAGQRVSHTGYGLGRVTGISGAGPRAVATVIFDSQPTQRSFIIGHRALVPVTDATDGSSPVTLASAEDPPGPDLE